MSDDPVASLRGVRRAGRARLPPGRRPLQGLGLLHDRLREEGRGEQQRRERRASRSRRSSRTRRARLVGSTRSPDSRLERDSSAISSSDRQARSSQSRIPTPADAEPALRDLALRAVRAPRRLRRRAALGGALALLLVRRRGCRPPVVARRLEDVGAAAAADRAPRSPAGASSAPPMLETIAFGAFQAISGPLRKFIGRLVMLVSLPLIPSRISCWNWARSTSPWPAKSPCRRCSSRVRARVIAWKPSRWFSPSSRSSLKAPPETLEQTGGRQVDRDPADRVDEAAKAVEVDDRDLVDVEPEQALDRAHRQLRAARTHRRS